MKNYEHFRLKIGKRFKEIRLLKNISLHVISLDTKIELKTLEIIESGLEDYYVEDLIKIAHSLNIEPSDLFSEEPFTF